MTSPRPAAVLPGRGHPHAEPQPYSLIQRTWDYAWWRPVTGILLGVVGMLLLIPFVLLPVLAAGVAIQGGPFAHNFDKAITLDDVTPAAMLYLNLTLAALTPYAILLMRVLHKLRARWLVSVLPGVRWRFLFACVGAGVVALVAQIVVGSFLPGDPNGLADSHPAWTSTTTALAIVILLTTPLQAIGEEFAFRGYLTQAFGSLTSGWFKDGRTARRVGSTCAVILPALFFALAHGTQNAPLFLDRLAFGLIAGFLVIKVGGIEAGIALHVLNNLLAFGVALAFGDVTESLTVSHVSWWQIPLTITQNGVFVIVVMLIARRMGLNNRTRPPAVEQPAS